MKIINFGSINIDHVYDVDHFVRPGETLSSKNYAVFSGGKGANQSIALARANADVLHVGKIGLDGIWLQEKMEKEGIDTHLVKIVKAPTGHAIIQVNSEGENAIIIHGGANLTFKSSDIKEALKSANAGDIVLLQNEINSVDKILKQTKDKDLKVVFNPAPMSDAVKEYPLELVDIFIINETEGEALSGEKKPMKIIKAMDKLYPKSAVVLTLGKKGVIYSQGKQTIKVDALKVKAVDTTGAGDTFIGYFLAELSRGKRIEKCLKTAVKAASICVTRKGAADSIPRLGVDV
ncbi:ribokinase [Sulfurimonas marina]|uniref:Ribokinase n=1 Tax=Sulfurimonas marina TaxID=2590551 RepID=A0A7M1AV24_9BACT|nr:ribokinase [Sulfurimonas marina]QOP41291.1 ribokinase [Sulfurimonas marina]